ncbi:hypothetical protein GQ600_14125 [Phytophthora cactorum]|nr:hypothetical protein GQ600_14125 [Phytophthora cactorum]
MPFASPRSTSSHKIKISKRTAPRPSESTIDLAIDAPSLHRVRLLAHRLLGVGLETPPRYLDGSCCLQSNPSLSLDETMTSCYLAWLQLIGAALVGVQPPPETPRMLLKLAQASPSPPSTLSVSLLVVEMVDEGDAH